MKIFATSLFAIVNDNYLSKLFESNNDDIEPINIFNKEILCFNTKGKRIDRKSKILVKSANHFPIFFLANIKDIQHNNVSIGNTETNKNIDIGILVDKKIKETMNFKLLTE